MLIQCALLCRAGPGRGKGLWSCVMFYADRSRRRSCAREGLLALRLACARAGGARRVLLRVRQWELARSRARTVLLVWRGLVSARRRRAQVRRAAPAGACDAPPRGPTGAAAPQAAVRLACRVRVGALAAVLHAWQRRAALQRCRAVALRAVMRRRAAAATARAFHTWSAAAVGEPAPR